MNKRCLLLCFQAELRAQLGGLAWLIGSDWILARGVPTWVPTSCCRLCYGTTQSTLHIVLQIKTFVGFFSQRIINCQSSERQNEIYGENSKFVNEEINPKTVTLILTLINYRHFFVLVLLSLNIAATVVEPLFKWTWLMIIFMVHSHFPLPQ